MIYRTSRILLEIVGVAIGGLLVVAALTIWRLSLAPLEGRFIRPVIERTINEADLGFAVKVTDARIEWRGFRPVLDLHFQGVNVSGQGGAAVGGFQDGTLGISVRQLVFGHAGVVTIDIHRPEITIVRDKSDHYALALGPGAAGREQSSNAAAAPAAAAGSSATNAFVALLQRFVEAPNDRSQVGRLQRVRLVDGRVLIDDRKLGLTWSVSKVNVDVLRTEGDVTAKIGTILDLPGSHARLSGQARYSPAGGKTQLSLDIDGLELAAAAPLANSLAPLSALAVPVSGRIHATLDHAGGLIEGGATLNGGPGKVVLPDYYPEPLAVQALGIDLHLTDGYRQLVLDRISIDLGDARMSATGTATFDGPSVAIDAKFDVANVPLARFDAIWPHGFAVGGRDWVIGHIPGGVIRNGTVHLSASGRTDAPDTIQATVLKGEFDYAGLEVHYFPPLPPVKSIAGHGVFDTRGMDLTIDSGTLQDIAVSGGAIALRGFDRDDRSIDVALSLDGPLRSALVVLDTKPLGYAHDLGIDPDLAFGHMNARANFSFPLVKTLTFRQIALGVKGRLDGVAVAGAVGRRDVTDGALDIALDKAGMTLAGKAKLSGVGVSLDWRENFEASQPTRSRIAFRSEVDDSGRSALAIVPPEIVTLHGAIGVDGLVTIARAGGTTLAATLDLGKASVGIDRFGLDKPAGEAATAGLSLEFVGDTIRRVSRLTIASHSLNLSGTADFAPDGSLSHAELPRVMTPRNDFALTVDAPAADSGAYTIAIKGSKLDLVPLLADKTPSPDSSSHTPLLDLTLALDRVLTGKENGLDAVQGSLRLAGGRLEQASLTAVAGKPVRFNFSPEGDVIALHFTAEDAGGALAGLDLTRGVRGGVLRLNGETNRSDGPRLTTGTIDMWNFRLTDAPIIARLVNAISLTGFMDLLTGQGLGFDRLSAGMSFADGKISFRDGRSAGALGIGFEGTVDLDQDKVALKGTVVPVDTFNRIVAAVPLLGDILTGGSRGGFFGWTYTVDGPTNDPSVSVNPLSMFAPGFLRNLFFLGPSAPAPKLDAAPESAAPPQPPGG